MEIDVKSLHPLEIKVLLHVKKGEQITAERIISELGYKLGQCNQAFSWLAAKELIIETDRINRIQYELTELGKAFYEIGFPAERMFNLLKEHGSLPLPEIAEKLGIDKSDVGSAFGKLSKQGIFAMNAEKMAEIREMILPPDLILARDLVRRGAEGPLEEVGFEVGDIILQLNGQDVEGIQGIVDLVNAIEPNARVTLPALDHKTGQTGYVQIAID